MSIPSVSRVVFALSLVVVPAVHAQTLRATPQHTIRGHNGILRRVAFSPDSQLLATASVDKTVKLWDAATGNEIETLRGHSGYVFSVAFSPDGQRLASAGGYRTHGEVKIWDTTAWREKLDK